MALYVRNSHFTLRSYLVPYFKKKCIHLHWYLSDGVINRAHSITYNAILIMSPHNIIGPSQYQIFMPGLDIFKTATKEIGSLQTFGRMDNVLNHKNSSKNQKTQCHKKLTQQHDPSQIQCINGKKKN